MLFQLNKALHIFYCKIGNTVVKEELENQKDSSLEFILCYFLALLSPGSFSEVFLLQRGASKQVSRNPVVSLLL